MANTSSLQIVTQLNSDHWQITATVLPGSFLPPAIFMYQNLGTTTLGPYQGICGISELLRLQAWGGVAIPVFGNRFVRDVQAKIIVGIDPNNTGAPQSVVNNLIATAKQLSLALQAAASSTQVVTV